MSWTSRNIPNQQGRLALVTGATGGLGLETALELARAGAEVVLSGRNAEKGADALSRIRTVVPGARVSYENLDLSRIANVTRFVEDFARRHGRLDLLINNAGVMAPPTRQVTLEGFELQFVTNYLAHFALTAGLLPLLAAAQGARVVPLSSVAAQQGRIDFANLQAERGYKPMVAYSQTKLACLMFGFEFQRRSAAGGWGIDAVTAHPGVSRTDLVNNGMGADSSMGFVRRWMQFLFQPVEMGALPTLMAATDPAARPGGYYGPTGMMEMRGAPGVAKPPAQALDAAVAKRLWDVSEELSGATFPRMGLAA
jgi:NAD(P)-dependent dehydrogenase (short-subunit alcohol dehydrogenase family)